MYLFGLQRIERRRQFLAQHIQRHLHFFARFRAGCRAQMSPKHPFPIGIKAVLHSLSGLTAGKRHTGRRIFALSNADYARDVQILRQHSAQALCQIVHQRIRRGAVHRLPQCAKNIQFACLAIGVIGV